MAETDVSKPEDQIPEAISSLSHITESITTLVAQQKSDSQQSATFQRRSLLVQRLLLVVTTCAFLAAAYYAYVAAQQRDIMDKTLAQIQRQTKAATDSAKAAQDAITQARDQFRQDQRPYLWVSNGKSGMPAFAKLLEKDKSGFLQYWDISIYNFGKTPAYHVGRKFFIQVGNKHPKSRSYGERDNNPPTLIAPTGEASIRVLSSPDIIQAEIDDIQKPHSGQTITIQGTITYADSYGTKYESGICLSRLNSGVIQYCDGNYVK